MARVWFNTDKYSLLLGLTHAGEFLALRTWCISNLWTFLLLISFAGAGMYRFLKKNCKRGHRWVKISIDVIFVENSAKMQHTGKSTKTVCILIFCSIPASIVERGSLTERMLYDTVWFVILLEKFYSSSYVLELFSLV